MQSRRGNAELFGDELSLRLYFEQSDNLFLVRVKLARARPARHDYFVFLFILLFKKYFTILN